MSDQTSLPPPGAAIAGLISALLAIIFLGLGAATLVHGFWTGAGEASNETLGSIIGFTGAGILAIILGLKTKALFALSQAFISVGTGLLERGWKALIPGWLSRLVRWCQKRLGR